MSTEYREAEAPLAQGKIPHALPDRTVVPSAERVETKFKGYPGIVQVQTSTPVAAERSATEYDPKSPPDPEARPMSNWFAGVKVIDKDEAYWADGNTEGNPGTNVPFSNKRAKREAVLVLLLIPIAKSVVSDA